jgi:outer membrane protein TolC
MNGRSLLARSARWATIPVCLLAGLANAQTSTYSLNDLIDRALQHNAQILAGRADVDEARAQLRQARGAFVLPRLRLESIGGLTPDGR